MKNSIKVLLKPDNNSNYITRKIKQHNLILIEKTNAYYGIYSNKKILYDKVVINRQAGKHSFGAIYALLFKKTSITGTLNTELNPFYFKNSQKNRKATSANGL